MTYVPGGSGGTIFTKSDVAFNNPAVKDGLIYDSSLAKWKNASVGAVVSSTSTTTRPASLGPCMFTGNDPGANAMPGDIWVSSAPAQGASVIVYDQQFNGANGGPWDGFGPILTFGLTGGLADQQNGDGRLRFNTSGGYGNRVGLSRTMTAVSDGAFSGAFRVPAAHPDIAIIPYIRGSGSQPTYQSQPATSYYLTIDTLASRIRFERQVNEQAALRIGEDTAYIMAPNAVIRWRMYTSGAQIKVRIWKNDETEPSGWKWEYTDAQPLPAGVDGIGLRGGPSFDSGDVYFLHLTRATIGTESSGMKVKKRDNEGSWIDGWLFVRNSQGAWI